MNVPYIFRFLKDLSEHNDREWFRVHKEEYRLAQQEFESLLTQVIGRIAVFDESVRSVQASDCTYRIYRDTRFSADKTPFKVHFGGYINAHGKKSDYCGYYVHLENGHCMLAGGSICLPPRTLKAIRRSIYENIEEYVSIVEDPSFKRFFPQIGDEHLKMPPKGFPKDFPQIDYLKCKDYTCTYMVPDDFFYAPDWLDRTEEVFRQLKRFANFTNYAIEEMV